jgi:predicted esterase
MDSPWSRRLLRYPSRPAARRRGGTLVVFVTAVLLATIPGVPSSATGAETPIPARGPAQAAGATAPAPSPAAPGSNLVIGDYFVHVPRATTARLEVLVALHGMGGAGPPFVQAIEARADRQRWLLVAPTYAYGDWRDPALVAGEGARLIPQLHAFLAALPERTGLDLAPQVAVYGFSRGAQIAHRFALIYPDQTLGVAAISAGTYTLPATETAVDGQTVTLRFPFGVADLQEHFGRTFDVAPLTRIPFWVAVGADDQNVDEVPRQWDPYVGRTRVERAQRFVQRLVGAGIPAELTAFPGVGHELSDEMRARALDFIAALPPQTGTAAATP